MTPMGQRRDHPHAERAPDLEDRPDVGDGLERGMDVVDAEALLRHHRSRRLGVGRHPPVLVAAEVAEVLASDRDGGRLVRHRDVDDPVRDLDVQRTDRLRGEGAEPTPLDHGGAAHADVRSFRCDHHVAAPQDGGVAREAATAGDPDQGDETGQLSEQVERQAVETGDADAIGVPRPATAALGEEDDRQSLPLRQLEEAVLLPVVLQALRAGQHGVVVRHGDDRVARHGADAADEPVGRGAGDEVVQRAAAPLGRDHHRPVLHEAVRIEEVLDVLPSGPLPRPPTALDGLGSRGVEPHLVPGPHLGQVGALPGRRIGGRRGTALGGLGARRREHGEEVPRLDEIAGGDPHLRHRAALRRVDRVLHLHRLDDRHLGAGLDEGACLDDTDHGALERR
jgi:hypothetical protein